MNGKQAKRLRKIAKEFSTEIQGMIDEKRLYKKFKKGLTSGDVRSVNADLQGKKR